MEDTVALNAIPLTYDELLAELSRVHALNTSLEARYATLYKTTEQTAKAHELTRNELHDITAMLEPFAAYIAKAMPSDAIKDIVIEVLESREAQEIIDSIVDDNISNLSIEIANRRR